MGKYQLALGLTGLVAAAAAAMPPFGDWSDPAVIQELNDSSAALSTPGVDGCASHSADGRTLVFNSSRSGIQDLYIATRGSVDEGFGDPVAIAELNRPDKIEFCPTIARGNRLYFSSSRDDPAGDLYVSRRGPDGVWSSPARLGGGINTPGVMEEAAAFYEDDEGRQVMLFTRRNPNPAIANAKIYQSVDGGAPELVEGSPNEVGSNARASITHDGRTIFFDSIRPGGIGGPDLYYATRSSASGPFGDAVHLVELSETGFEARPFISWDGTLLTFSSTRNGAAAPDIWFATRSRATGN